MSHTLHESGNSDEIKMLDNEIISLEKSIQPLCIRLPTIFGAFGQM